MSALARTRGLEELAALVPFLQEEGGAREGEPDELGAGALGLVVGEAALLAHELELVVRERDELDVGPAFGLRGEGDLRPFVLFDRGGGEEVGELIAQQLGADRDRPDAVAVEALRELLHERVVRIGGDVVDDHLAARDADRDGVVSRHRGVEALHDALDRGAELRVAGRIDRVLLHGDAEVQEEFGDALVETAGGGARRVAGSWRRDGLAHRSGRTEALEGIRSMHPRTTGRGKGNCPGG